MKFFRALVLVFLLLAPTFPQEIPEDFKPPRYRTQIVEVVKSPRRFTKNFLFVVDKSGSMAEDDISQALGAFRYISQAPVDEMQIGVIAFGTASDRWVGIPETGAHPVGRGWAALPSATAIKKANEFLQNTPVHGGTDLSTALNLLKTETRKDPFDVIIISDGCFDYQVETEGHEDASSSQIAGYFVSMIDRIIAHRTKNKLPAFRLHFYGINIQDNDTVKVLTILAKKYGTFINETRTQIR